MLFRSPSRSIPLRLAHRSRYSGTQSLLVALEYLEWICKSAIYMSVHLYLLVERDGAALVVCVVFIWNAIIIARFSEACKVEIGSIML